MSVCKYCGEGNMILRNSKFGNFYGCSRYPDCAGTEKIEKKVNSLEEQANIILGEKPI